MFIFDLHVTRLTKTPSYSTQISNYTWNANPSPSPPRKKVSLWGPAPFPEAKPELTPSSHAYGISYRLLHPQQKISQYLHRFNGHQLDCKCVSIYKQKARRAAAGEMHPGCKLRLSCFARQAPLPPAVTRCVAFPPSGFRNHLVPGVWSGPNSACFTAGAGVRPTLNNDGSRQTLLNYNRVNLACSAAVFHVTELLCVRWRPGASRVCLLARWRAVYGGALINTVIFYCI